MSATNAKEPKNWLEWIVFAIGCVLVLGAIGALGYQTWIAAPPKPPTIEVILGQAEAHAGHYAIPVRVANRGDETAEAVLVQVTLEMSDGKSEKSEFQIQFLPRNASREGWVIFETDPATAKKIRARPLGYAKP